MYHQNKHYTANMIGNIINNTILHLTVHLVNFALKSQTTLTTLLGKAKQKHDESKFIQ
jgi:hypothetical protein